MDKQETVDFLFDISKELKQFYETPVIFLTNKNFSDEIFNAMCSLRTALIADSKNDVIDHIVDYHLQWIHAVNDIDNFKKRIHDIPKEEVYEAISYTIDAMTSRLKYYQRYMEDKLPYLRNADQANIKADLEIVEEMHTEVTHELLQKLKCFRGLINDAEFKIKLNETVEDLLFWLDKINDSLSMLLSKYININVPHLSTDLTKTLQQIINEVHTSDSPSAQKMLEDLKKRGREMGSMIRCTASHNLEISKVVEKINVLDDRIRRLESEPSSAAVMALSHKKEYLEKRLTSLENLKTTLDNLHKEAGLELGTPTGDECVCVDFFKLRIFNHALPLEERERLVTQLCYLWDLAVFGERSRKSIISILSAADIKEEFTDDLGCFYIDEHSRKIYKIPDDERLYQPNENNELVPLTDDRDHVYFYDECGRYFINAKTRQRVYKAHGTASEYMMDSFGVLLKTKEERDRTVYYYDNFGRYYINEEGKNIYREADTASEYENDGLGNLVRIRSQLDQFQLCSDDVHVTEDFKYLKRTVGPALRSCIAQCILHQPSDPIKYLSHSLIQYRENIEAKEKHNRDKEALFSQREIILAEERAAAEAAARAAALFAQGGSECSYDSNLLKYTTEHATDITSTSSK